MNPSSLSAQQVLTQPASAKARPPPLTPQLKKPPWLPNGHPGRALPLDLAVKDHLCFSLPELLPSSSTWLVLSFPLIALSPSVCAHGLTCP